MAEVNEEGSLLGGKRTGSTGYGRWYLESKVPCVPLLSCKNGQKTEAFHDGPVCALWVEMLLPLSWLCFGVRSPVGCAPEAAGAACAASSSKGANAWPVMSGVTRPWFQNTAVNKVKVSPFAGKEVCFYELDSTWMKSFSKQTSRLYAWVFFLSGLKRNKLSRWALLLVIL